MSGSAVWRGASGKSYTYLVLSLKEKPASGYGNYIYARLEGSAWCAVYIGQGELSARSDLGSHHKGDVIRLKGATHVHVRENSSLQARMDERADILDGHPEAYEPIGGHSRALS
jgi:hypothetical protein